VRSWRVTERTSKRSRYERRSYLRPDGVADAREHDDGLSHRRRALLIYLIVFDRISWWTTIVASWWRRRTTSMDRRATSRHDDLGRLPRSFADKVIVLGGLRHHHLAPARDHVLHRPGDHHHPARDLDECVPARAAKHGTSIPASRLAKWKTFVQDWAIGFCVLPITGHPGVRLRHDLAGGRTHRLHRMAVLRRRETSGRACGLRSSRLVLTSPRTDSAPIRSGWASS